MLTYESAVQLAFERIEQNLVCSSWKDAFVSSNTPQQMMQYINVPSFGCFKDVKLRPIKENPEAVMKNVWSIGSEKGWHYGNFLWKLLGVADKLFGGIGLRCGRTNNNSINAGDALDFWRVLIADK